ncbi:MAG: YdcF family protein [Beijerinckiaceae bacterium]
MFYHVSKIAWFFVEPSNVIALLIAAGLALLLLRFRRLGSLLAGFGAVLLVVIGLTPFANWLILPLEMRFPPVDLAGRTVDGVIVLGGAVQERPTLAHGRMAFNEAGERVVAMADLARRYPDARVIFTGGAGFYSHAPAPEADVLRSRLSELGLGENRVVFENRSVNTHENALFSFEVAKPKPGETWLLVTSAWHMPRSVGIFRHAGWPVVAYPVDHRTAGWGDATRGFTSVSDGLRRADISVREWLGLLVYRLTDRTDALFPAP